MGAAAVSDSLQCMSSRTPVRLCRRELVKMLTREGCCRTSASAWLQPAARLRTGATCPFRTSSQDLSPTPAHADDVLCKSVHRYRYGSTIDIHRHRGYTMRRATNLGTRVLTGRGGDAVHVLVVAVGILHGYHILIPELNFDYMYWLYRAYNTIVPSNPNRSPRSVFPFSHSHFRVARCKNPR